MDDYRDIIDLPRPEPRHPRMSAAARAIQFGSFDAVSGLQEAIELADQEKAAGKGISRALCEQAAQPTDTGNMATADNKRGTSEE